MTKIKRNHPRTKILVKEWIQIVKDRSTDWTATTAVFAGKPSGYKNGDEIVTIGSENSQYAFLEAKLIEKAIFDGIECVRYCGQVEDEISENTYIQFITGRNKHKEERPKKVKKPKVNNSVTVEPNAETSVEDELTIEYYVKNIFVPDEESIVETLVYYGHIYNNLLKGPKPFRSIGKMDYDVLENGKTRIIFDDIRKKYKNAITNLKLAERLNIIGKVDKVNYAWTYPTIPSRALASLVAVTDAFENYVYQKLKKLPAEEIKEEVPVVDTTNETVNEIAPVVSDEVHERNRYTKEFQITPDYITMPSAELLKLDFNGMTEREVNMFIAQALIRVIVDGENIKTSQGKQTESTVRMATAIERATSK